MKNIFRYFLDYKPRVFFCLLLKITGIVMELLIPILLSNMIDDIVPNYGLKEIILVGLLMIFCSAMGFLGNCKANQIAASIAKRITIRIRKELFTKIMSLSNSQIDNVTIPSLVARMSSDTYNIHQMMAMILRLGVRAPILLIGGIIITIILDPVISLTLIIVLPIVIFIIIFITKKALPYFTKGQLAIDKLVLSIRENMTGIRVIKSLSKEDYEMGRFDHVNKEVIKYELKQGKIMASIRPLVNLALNAGLISVLVIGAIRVNKGLILPGKVLAFTTYFSLILTAVIALTRLITIITKAYASNLRIKMILDLGRDLQIEQINVASDAYIEFRDVEFSYDKKEPNLTSLSFKVNKGETLGIIGPTGCGKTTIINLLLRFYDVDKGNIIFNGKDIRELSDTSLKKEIGIAMQNDNLFEDSILNNITFYRKIPKDQINKAIHTAQADFIYQLNGGLDFKLAVKGNNLSGGQKQRILLARALANNPSLLILDDSTSALDYKTEANFRLKLKENYQDTTCIIIASRISSIKDAKQIIVLDDGKCVGIGNHQSLLKTCCDYKMIYNSQMGGDANE